MGKLLDAVRQAVCASKKSRYQIAKESGVSAGQLSRLVNEQRGLDSETIEQLADYLGLQITIEAKIKRKDR